jgi:hypothetical protein
VTVDTVKWLETGRSFISFGDKRTRAGISGDSERSEFELPVPLSKLSDNSLMLSFATSRRVVKRSHPGLHLWRASGLSLKRTVPNWIALSRRSSRGVAHVARGKRSP